MDAVFDFFQTIFNQLWYSISTIRFADILDIAIVAFLIYKSIELFRETRAGTLIKGILIVLVTYAVAVSFELVVIKWLLVKIASVAVIAVAIVFQPELRRALERVGRSNFKKFGSGYYGLNDDMVEAINSVAKSAGEMQEAKTGALIVLERETPLGEVIDTGIMINADISSALISNIFYPKSPLHDGGVVIRDGRVHAASCILPLSTNPNLDSELGTRHRAGLGVTEVSDAIVIIVSEETGTISVAHNGVIERGYNSITLRERLKELMDDSIENTGRKSVIASFVGAIFNKKKGEDEQ